MKQIDFTHPGGFPLTQDQLGYLEAAYTECINALAAMGSDGSTPMVISGMVQSVPTVGSVAVTDGWFFYGGEMIPFTGATVAIAGSNVPLVVITAASTNLTYNDGSSYPAILVKTATLVAAPTLTDATHFPLSAAQPFQQVFGRNGREATWNSLGVATGTPAGNVTGTIYYRKNWLTNTLQIRAQLTANAAQNFAASPGAIFSLMGTLPSGYAPNNTAYFTSYYYAGNMFKDDLGVAWVKEVTSNINTAGQVYVNFIRPDIAISAYSLVFNTIIPLD